MMGAEVRAMETIGFGRRDRRGERERNMRMKLATFATVLGLLGLSSTAFAQGMAPAVMPMQGFLTDSAGTAIDGDVDLTITIYDGQTSTTELYGETQTVMVDEGSFTAYVGEGTPTGAAFDLAIFRDNSDTWVGIAIDGGTELPRFQLGSVPYAGFAQYSNTAGNAVRLGGMPATNYATTADAQARVTGTCSGGDAIVGINPDGTVNCASVGSSISHTCPAGQAITAIASDGTVTCAAFGDISAVGAGVGLVGGGTSGAVTLNVAPNGITSAHLADDSVGISELDESTMASGTQFTTARDGGGTLAITDNYYLSSASVTPPGNGKCLVMATAQIDSDSADDAEAFIRTARREGAAAPTNDGVTGMYIRSSGTTRTVALTATHVWDVTGGTAYRFGCYIGISSFAPIGGVSGADFAGDPADCRVTWMCY